MDLLESPHHSLPPPHEIFATHHKFSPWILGIILLTITVGIFSWAMLLTQKEPEPMMNEVCIKVITRARNMETGEVRDLPIPCK
jgi:hypothetical protein